MDPVRILQPSLFGLALAAAAVAAGAPVFSEGLRALRLRRLLRDLRDAPLGDLPSGFVHTTGMVALESPLFGPLSGRPCAGFTLEIEGVGSPAAGSVHVRRPFRLEGDGVSARVLGARGRWDVAVSAEREVAAGQPLTENVRALVARVPEILWWRRAGGAIRIVERALLAESECHVVGTARQARPLEMAVEVERLRTGTDDTVVEIVTAGGAPAHEPDLWIHPGEHLDFLLVSDRAPEPRRHAGHALRQAGVVLGPALTLAGLFYLASAGDHLRAFGRF